MILLENNWGKVRCPKCDSVMAIEKDDIRDTYEDGHYVLCPVCDSKVWFNDDVEEHPVVSKILSGQTWHK